MQQQQHFHRARIGVPTILFPLPSLDKMQCLKRRTHTATYEHKHYIPNTDSFVRIIISGAQATLEKRATSGMESVWRARLTLIKNARTGRRYWYLKLRPASDGKRPDRSLSFIRKPKKYKEMKHMFSTMDMGKACIHMPPIRQPLRQVA